MLDLSQLLKELISLPGLSGNEAPVRSIISESWRPLVDEIHTSRLGSLHALKRSSAPEPRRKVMLAAHMDAIGLMVRSIDHGFLHITQIGGVDHRILPGQPVTVHARRDLPAVVVAPPERLLPPNHGDKPVEMENLLVDTGLLEEEVRQLVRIGDLVSFAQPPLELTGDAIAGHSLDNRASVVAVTACLQALQKMTVGWDVWAVATVQEEETLGGAYTSAFEIEPDLAIAIDVTHAKGPGTNEYNTFPLGKGVVLGWGANIHPALYRRFEEIARQMELPYAMEVMPANSGTDAVGMQVVAAGIPTMVLSIPMRYMHTPVEMVSMKDIQRTGRLLAQFIASLEPDFLERIRWDEI